jgi:histidinol-phosphatase
VVAVKSSEVKDWLNFAREIIDEGRQFVISEISKGLETEEKLDKSFVTNIDKKLELLVQKRVSAKFPEHGVLGEEFGKFNQGATTLWIVDPIDGTQNLVHGIPTFGFVLGVWHEGVPYVGVIDHPLQKNEEFYGARGEGAFRSGKKLSLVDKPLGNSDIVALSTRDCFERSNHGIIFDEMMKHHPSTRVYFDIYSTTRTIQGSVAVVMEYNMKIWDIAATEILITEAGGKIDYVEFPISASRGPMVSLIAGKPSAVNQVKEAIQDVVIANPIRKGTGITGLF